MARTDEPRAQEPALPAAAEDVLVEVWSDADARSDDESRAQVTLELLRAGRAGFDALVRELCSEDDRRRAAAITLIPCFEERAGPWLAEHLEEGTADTAGIAAVLPAISRFLRDPAAGEPLWRVLISRFDDPALYDGDVHDALRDMVMSARGLTPELTARWEESDGNAAETAALALVHLRAYSGDAVYVAAPYLDDADASNDRVWQAFWIVYWSGKIDPALLVHIIALARTEDVSRLRAFTKLMREWGAAAEPVASDLLRLLRHSDHDVRHPAADALAAIPGFAAAHWREILDAGFDADWDAWALEPLFWIDEVRARAVAALPELDEAERVYVEDLTLASYRIPAEVAVLDRVLRTGDRERRTRVLRHLRERRAQASSADDVPIRPSVLELLDDPDEEIRLAAFSLAVYCDALPRDRALQLAPALVMDGDSPARGDAFLALCRARPGDPALLDEALQFLRADDAVLIAASIDVLALDDAPITGEHADVVDAIRASLEAPVPPTATDEAHVRALLRFDGGEHVARVAVERRLREQAAGASLMRGARLFGDAARARLVAWLRQRTGGTVHGDSDVARFLADCSDEPRVIAACGEVSVATAERLLALGDEGRAQLPVLIARAHSDHRDALLARLEGVITAADVERASVRGSERRPPRHRNSGPRPWDAPILGDGIYFQTRLRSVDQAARRGAVILAEMLPPERSVPLLVSMVHEPTVDAPALEALIRVETEHPGTVPVEVVAGLLSNDGVRERRETYELAARLGPRGAALSEILTECCAASSQPLAAADALRRLTGDDTALRTALLAGKRDSVRVVGDWRVDRQEEERTTALSATIAWTQTERETILREFMRGASRWDQRTWLPLVAALGEDAAPAVPELCRRLQERYVDGNHGEVFTSSGPGVPFARALRALGPAADGAAPALHHWTAATGGDDD